MEKKRLVLMVVFGMFVLAACATTGGVEVLPGDIEKGIAVEKPIWSIGDTWTYKIVRVKSGEKNEFVQKRIVKEIVEKKGGKKYYVVSAAQGKINRYHDAANLNLKYVKDASGEVTERYIPEFPMFNWPLKVEKQWGARYSWESPLAGPDNPPWVDVTVKVVGQEPIFVMGKEIMTFKLLHHRYSQRGLLVCELTQWYSPELKNIVKWTDERQPINYYETGELIKFSLEK